MVSISSTFYASLLRQYFCGKKLQSQNITREKLCKALSYKIFLCKMLMKLSTDVLTHILAYDRDLGILRVIKDVTLANNDTYCSQFHQHFTRNFFCRYPFAKKLQSQNVTRENMREALSYEKHERKC